ncbi:MAG: hypothetical protein NTW87_17800 [Planctomycetota bacterium]|nr:hypothetical protein [Planctomycetota bacterium]
MAIVATLVAAILAPPFGANTTGLIVALAATLSAVTIVSTLAIPYLAVCLVGLLKGRRPSFQLHLSTCIALMFLASLLLWANLAHDFQGWPIVGKNGSWSFPVAAWHQSLAEPPGCLLVWSLNISACVAMLGGTAIILETLTVRRKEGVKKI